MAIKGMYVADGITTYTTADVKLINSKFANNKIVWGENDLKVEAQTTPAMSIKVASGLCSINGDFLQNTSSYTVSINSNTASYPRIDAVVAYINGTTREIKVLEGTASSNPSAPSCTSSIYVKLAEVYVGVGVTAIQISNIKDCRSENDILNSLSETLLDIKETVDDMKDYKVIHADVNADRGYRKHEDGYCRAWGSGIQNIAGNALDITVAIPYSFKNTASCSVMARGVDNEGKPINLIVQMSSANQVRLVYPSTMTPRLANGGMSWYVSVEGY